MLKDVSETCDDRFIIYTNVKLCCIPETNTILYVHCTSIKKRKKL